MVSHRHGSSGAVGQKTLRTLLCSVLKENSVEARSWGVVNLDKVLVCPGGHAKEVEVVHHLVAEFFITRRARPVVVFRKITEGKTERL